MATIKRGKSSSTAGTGQDTEQRKESLITRIQTKLETTKDGESDRESCASHRSQDSLDLLDDDLQAISGSQQDLRRFASTEDLDQEPGPESTGPEQNDYPVTVEVTLQDCRGERPPPHHLMRQQAGCKVELQLGVPVVRIEEPLEEPQEKLQETEAANNVTVTEHDKDSTHSHNQEWEPPGEGDADTASGQSAHGPINSSQDIGMEENIPTSVGATPDVPLQGSQEPLLHFQEHPEVDTGDQDSEHSKSHDDPLQKILAEEGAGVDQPPPPDDSPEQGLEVSEELLASVEASPDLIDEPVAVVFRSVCDCVDEEKCGHQTYWEGKVVSEEGQLELWLERGVGKSVRYPPQVPKRYKKDETVTEELV